MLMAFGLTAFSQVAPPGASLIDPSTRVAPVVSQPGEIVPASSREIAVQELKASEIDMKANQKEMPVSETRIGESTIVIPESQKEAGGVTTNQPVEKKVAIAESLKQQNGITTFAYTSEKNTEKSRNNSDNREIEMFFKGLDKTTGPKLEALAKSTEFHSVKVDYYTGSVKISGPASIVNEAAVKSWVKQNLFSSPLNH